MVDSFYLYRNKYIPRLAATLSIRDILGTIGARTGFTRSAYDVTPGLYCIGSPDAAAPVLVTCNYKLSVDSLRQHLALMDVWLLVIDTRGINVWCAAGKGTFSTEEVAYQVNRTHLTDLVDHGRLILPQLAAPGVAAAQLHKLCGFSALFGPIRASDVADFIISNTASEEMRTVTFPLPERLKLIPVEICLFWKQFLTILTVICALSFIGSEDHTFSGTIACFLPFAIASCAGLLSGALLTPVLLPVLPARQFWLKGIFTGSITSILLLFIQPESPLISTAVAFWVISLSSYTAMLFTGSTPYTSLTGVGVEMKRGLPVQTGLTLAAVTLFFLSQ
jgi:hypothetical protein